MTVDRELLLHVRAHDTIPSVLQQATRAEELGYRRVSMGEATGWNRVGLLTLVADRTEELGLTNDVFSPYSRSPALLGQTTAMLQRLSSGRYRLGLGTSSPALVENWHGLSFDRPLRRLRETIEIVRQVVGGERVGYDGEIFDLEGFKLEDPAPDTVSPIDIAAIGPKTVELAGRFADGWVPQMFSPDGLQNRLEDLRRGIDLGDRDPGAVRTSFILRCCAMEDRERAREIARNHVAFVIGAYGPYYRKSIERQGYEDTAAELRKRWEAGDRDRMAEVVSDDLLDELVAAGTPTEVKERYTDFATVDGIDALRVGFFDGQPVENQLETMEALAEL